MLRSRVRKRRTQAPGARTGHFMEGPQTSGLRVPQLLSLHPLETCLLTWTKRQPSPQRGSDPLPISLWSSNRQNPPNPVHSPNPGGELRGSGTQSFGWVLKGHLNEEGVPGMPQDLAHTAWVGVGGCDLALLGGSFPFSVSILLLSLHVLPLALCLSPGLLACQGAGDKTGWGQAESCSRGCKPHPEI